MKRASTTILFLTSERIVRADFRGGTKPKWIESWQSVPPPEVESLSLLAEVALSLGPKPGHRVWVLSTEVWTQTVSLPTSVSGLSQDEVDRAIGYEIEPLSGLNVFDSAVNAKKIERYLDQEVFWVAQTRQEELERLGQVLTNAGSKLAGVCHPAGLPRPIADSAAVWQRVELWPEAVVCLESKEKGSPRVLVIHADPEQGLWKSEFDAWRSLSEQSVHCEIRTLSGAVTTLDADENPVEQLGEEEALPVWLGRWAEQFAREPDVPVLNLPPPPIPESIWQVVAVAAFCIAIFACVAHHLFVRQLVTSEKSELASIKQKQDQKRAIDKQQEKLSKTLAELKAEVAELGEKCQQCQTVMSVQKRRLAELLKITASHCPKDLIVRKIAGKPGNPEIQGVCLGNEAANRFSAAIDRDLRRLSWRVTSQELSGNGSLKQFTISLREIASPLVRKTKTKTKKKARRR